MIKHCLLFLTVCFTACFWLVSCKTNKSIAKTVSREDNQIISVDTVNPKNVGVKDTVGYIKGVIDNKSQYKNKELGLLLNDLKIKVKSYFMMNTNLKEIDGLVLYFDDLNTVNKKIDETDQLKRPGVLYVKFKSPISVSTYQQMVEKSKGVWQAPEQEFYSKQILVDLN